MRHRFYALLENPVVRLGGSKCKDLKKPDGQFTVFKIIVNGLYVDIYVNISQLNMMSLIGVLPPPLSFR